MEMFWGPGMWGAVAIAGVVGWVVTNWLKVRHGYPLDDGAGGLIHPRGDGVLEKALADRDAKIKKLEERMRVLEQIVTDNYQSHDLAKEIEGLRAQDA